MNRLIGDRAVVVGGSITGTLAARVLSESYRDVVVVDREQHVRIWISLAHELWGLTSEEVDGEHIFSLDIGFPVEKLRGALRSVLTDNAAREEVTVQATNRRGGSLASGGRPT